MEKLEYKERGANSQLLTQCGALMNRPLRTDENVSSALSVLGSALEASRIGLFVKETPDSILQLFEWSREKGFSAFGSSNVFLTGKAAKECLSMSGSLLYTEDDIIRMDKHVFEAYGLLLNHTAKSILALPLEWNGSMRGFIGIEDPSAEKVSQLSAFLLSAPYIILEPVIREQEEIRLKRALASLSDRKLVYEMTAENAKLIVFETDLVKKVTVSVDSPYSRRFMRKAGFPKLMQDPVAVLSSHTDEEGKQAFSTCLKQVMQGQKDAGCSFRLSLQTGEEPLFIKANLYGACNRTGQVVKVYSVFQDISDYVRSEELLKAESERAIELKRREDELSAMKNRELELLQKHKIAIDSLEFILWEMDLYAESMIPMPSPFFEKCRKLYNIPADDAAIPDYLYHMLDTEDQLRVKKMFTSLRQGRRYTMDVRLATEKGGVVRTFRLAATPSKSEAGDWDSAVATTYDVTDQLVKSSGYEQELAYFTLSRDDSVMMSTRVNLTMNSFIDCYPALPPETKGLSYDAIVARGKGLEGYLKDGRPSSEVVSRSFLLNEWANGRTKNSYVIRYTGQGSVKWCRADMRLMENPGTKDVECFFYLTDVTRNELMTRLLERLGDVVYEFIGIMSPADNTIGFIGHSDYDDLQYIDYDAFIARELREHVILQGTEQEFRDEVSFASIQKELAADSHFSRIISWKGGHGEPLRKMIQYFYLDPGRELILCCITDVTDQYRQDQMRLQEVEDALHRADVANRAKSEFVSRISHDIRTPIGAVLNLTQFAEEDIGHEDKLIDDLAKIKTSGRFLLSLINDVLDISKIDSGKIELLPEACSYDAFIDEISNLLESMCYDKGLDCIINAAPPEVRAFMADKVRLNQVTLNLLSNSVKYTPSGGAVSFFVDQEIHSEGTVILHICVADNGIGMTEEFQRKMFDEFTQDSKNPLRDKTTPGTGLGLSIVNKMVQLMGGQIKVFSKVGKGSSFLVSIPMRIADEKNVKNTAKKTTAGADAPIAATILLAEDNLINKEIAERIFTKMGVTVEHADNGEEAVTLFSGAEPGHFDVVFMDIQMPKMDGYAATKAIRALDRPDAQKIPVVAMTANAFADAVQKAKDVGMDEYVTKPLDPDRLREVLQDLLAKRC